MPGRPRRCGKFDPFMGGWGEGGLRVSQLHGTPRAPCDGLYELDVVLMFIVCQLLLAIRCYDQFPGLSGVRNGGGGDAAAAAAGTRPALFCLGFAWTLLGLCSAAHSPIPSATHHPPYTHPLHSVTRSALFAWALLRCSVSCRAANLSRVGCSDCRMYSNGNSTVTAADVN